MTHFNQTELLNIAYKIKYDWFNNGFCNFYDNEDYQERLTVLEAHQDFYEIKKEVSFLVAIYDLATETIQDANANFEEGTVDYVFNGDWLDDTFGEDRLKEFLASLISKLEIK